MLAASEQLTAAEPWIELEQDELLVCDPDRGASTRASSACSGDRADEVEFVPLDSGELSGAARGEWAAQRAATGF